MKSDLQKTISEELIISGEVFSTCGALVLA